MLNGNEESLKAKRTANMLTSRSLTSLCILVQHKWFLRGKELSLGSVIPQKTSLPSLEQGLEPYLLQAWHHTGE